MQHFFAFLKKSVDKNIQPRYNEVDVRNTSTKTDTGGEEYDKPNSFGKKDRRIRQKEGIPCKEMWVVPPRLS